jgi:hypothetical protein
LIRVKSIRQPAGHTSKKERSKEATTMSLVRITRELRENVRAALESPYRFETCERFAMRQLVGQGAENHIADIVYVNAASKALRRRSRAAVPRLDSPQSRRIAGGS